MTSCDSALVNGNWYYTSQIAISNFTSNIGCDSTVFTPIIINNSIEEIAPDIITCDSAQVNGTWYSSTQTVTINLNTSLGCDSIVTTDLIVNQPVSSIIFDTIALGSTYLLPDGSITNLAGEYIVNILSVHNCDSSITVNLFVDDNVGLSGKLGNNFNWQIYPNPSTESFWIKLPDIQESFEIVIKNFLGQIIYKKEKVETILNVNTFSWSQGIYIVSIKDENGGINEYQKILINK
jgi:hypothetical protein